MSESGRETEVYGNRYCYRGPYERPELVIIEIDIEGSFLNSCTHPENFADNPSVDDDSYTDDFD